MRYVTPVMAIATGLLSLVLDPWREFSKTSYFDNSWHVARSCPLMFFFFLGALVFFIAQTFPFSLLTEFSVDFGGLIFCFPCFQRSEVESCDLII
jgi:hypothetical protein